jgi:uncharacterized protein YcbK (DUF882 family)
MNKREFLRTICTLLLSGAPTSLLAKAHNIQYGYKSALDTDFWNRPRRLNICRQDNKEKLNLIFYSNGSYDYHVYKLYCWLFRDIKSKNAVRYIDIALLNLLFGIQEWSRLMGSYDPVYILNSGYRTYERNQKIESAAKNSMHILGKAADGKFNGISIDNTVKMAMYFAAGGVGRYSSFIHLDTSKVRKWRVS